MAAIYRRNDLCYSDKNYLNDQDKNVKALMPKPDWQPDTPLYLQLYQRYREAITSGRLRPGERVPSIRNLASELHVARGTVEMAYQMLVSEGYLVTKGRQVPEFPLNWRGYRMSVIRHNDAKPPLRSLIRRA
jgi:GntR family transcriptional regulator/MocR family aminotransferase